MKNFKTYKGNTFILVMEGAKNIQRGSLVFREGGTFSEILGKSKLSIKLFMGS